MQLRPGDPGYVYDKQVEFTPAAEANDWDDSGDEDEEPAAAVSHVERFAAACAVWHVARDF